MRQWARRWQAIPVASALDVLFTLVALALVGASYVVGRALTRSGARLFLGTPPLFGDWLPHTGIGTPFVLAIAVAAVWFSAPVVARLRWVHLVPVAWCAAVAWTASLALIDGWQRGWVDRLTNQDEYLHDLPRIGGVGAFLRGFTSHILDFKPGSWTTHVSSHPPGATLVFLLLDRIGLGGGAWAGALVIAVGSLAAVAVPVTIRALGAPDAARRVIPFTVFLPGAVWVGVSADGLFAGVAASAVAVAVVGVLGVRRYSPVVALSGGALLGMSAYLSYGLALMGLVVAAAALCSGLRLAGRGRWLRRWTVRWGWVGAGVAVVVLGFWMSGFSWAQGVELLRIRYYQGIASVRPFHYFIWANFAALALSAGPMFAAGLVRAGWVLIGSARVVAAWWPRAKAAGGVPEPPAVPEQRRLSLPDGGTPDRVEPDPPWNDRWPAETFVPAILAFAAFAAMVAADLSALTKAETERIWLPYAFWLICGLALLPRRHARWALAVQVSTALLVNHLVLTHW
jgi:hypothetical protein